MYLAARVMYLAARMICLVASSFSPTKEAVPYPARQVVTWTFPS
jgi:hypothetical protein